MNAGWNASGRFTGAGSDVGGGVTAGSEPPSDPATRTATITSTSVSPTPTTAAPMREFLDLRSRNSSKRVSLCGVFVLDISITSTARRMPCAAR